MLHLALKVLLFASLGLACCFKKTKTSLKGNSCEDEIGVTGPCEAIIPSFTFNHKVGKCQEFTYGGCEGSNNRFKSKKDCENECGERHTILLVKFIEYRLFII